MKQANNQKTHLKAGLPKHGTRWARAQTSTPRKLSREERTAPTVRLSVRLRGKQKPAKQLLSTLSHRRLEVDAEWT
jgi:hypothetical protein